MLAFNAAIKLFMKDRIRELANTDDGIRFLKLRSLSRKEHMEYLIDKIGLDIGDTKSKGWLELIYESKIQADAIDKIIVEIYERVRKTRRDSEGQLVNELYKIQSFEWGGLHQNSLEKTIVDNYVKKITSYDSLSYAIENDLHNSMRAYVLASWYNHWSSIIIEDVFKDHEKVIPAVGLIKKIDFFINNKPFDLKVTYLTRRLYQRLSKSTGLAP